MNKRVTHRVLSAVVATTLLSSFAVVANAATSFSKGVTHIYVNGKNISNPSHIVAPDPWSGQNTSWVPVYYLEAALQQLGAKTSWNGTDVSVVPPSSWTVNDVGITQNKKLSSGDMDFVVSGNQLEIAPKTTAVDATTGKSTTYIPVFYADVLLERRLHIDVTWDGENWRLSRMASPVSKAEINRVMSHTVEVKDPTEHFTASGGEPITVPDGRGGTLTAVVGTRFPTADGYGQLVFFWHNQTYLGTSAVSEASEIESLQPNGVASFTVTYANYAPTDPMVNPSLPPQSVHYTWNGQSLNASVAQAKGTMLGIQVKYEG